MRTLWIKGAYIAWTGLVLSACSDVPDAGTLNKGGAPSTSAGSSNDTGGMATEGGASFGGAPPVGGAAPQAGTAGSAVPGGSGGQPGAGGSTGGAEPGAGTGGSEPIPVGGSAGTEPIGGSAGMDQTGGSAGMPPQGGTGGAMETGPYAPRTGSFKMLVYSQVCCNAFAHDSRGAGRTMLQQISQKQGFEVTLANDESEINPTGLAKYEIVFFLNSTGDLWQSGNLRRDFEAWIRNNGAYAGMHGATDSASSWSFYKELTGQYYDQHDAGVVAGTIQWTTAGLAHVAGRRDLPSPWNRQEEWYRFRSWQTWSDRPGFVVLNTVTTNDGGTRPVSYLREWENIRAFYTSLGHANAPYTDETVIKHVTAGIMWAVRREADIKP